MTARQSLIVIRLTFVLLCEFVGWTFWASREHPVINGVRYFEICGKKEGKQMFDPVVIKMMDAMPVPQQGTWGLNRIGDCYIWTHYTTHVRAH